MKRNTLLQLHDTQEELDENLLISKELECKIQKLNHQVSSQNESLHLQKMKAACSKRPQRN